MGKKKKALTTQLGSKVQAADVPKQAVIETIQNPHQDILFTARFSCPEFTSLCPVTGQPDFAHLTIDYVPKACLVESKSLKLFLTSFRNHGAFHEDCTVYIAKRLFEASRPHWLRIMGMWFPRGGIPINVFCTLGSLPRGIDGTALPMFVGAPK